MKKFLTVLLALSVVFTYTVGTAFAVTTSEGDFNGNVNSAKNRVYGLIEGAYNDALPSIKDTSDGMAISADSWKAVAKEYMQAQKAVADERADEIKANYATLGDKTIAELIDLFAVAKSTAADATQFTKSDAPVTTASAFITALNTDTALKDKAARIEFDSVKKAAIDNLKATDISMYSTTVQTINGVKTSYNAIAKKVIDDAIAEIEAIKIASDANVTTVATEIAKIGAAGKSAYGTVAAEPGTEALAVIEAVRDDKGKETGKYQISAATVTAKGLKTIAQEAGEALTLEAAKNAALAQMNAEVSKYLAAKVNGTSEEVAAAQKLADAYKTAQTYRINAAETKDEITGANLPKAIADADKYVENVAAIQELEAYAAKYKVAKDENGALAYDADAIDAVVDAAKDNAYNNTGAAYTALDSDKSAIENKKVTTLDTFEVAKAKAQIEASRDAKLYDDGEDLFYAPEKAKAEALYNDLLAELEKATKISEVTAVTDKISGVESKVDGLDNKTEVIGHVKTAFADDWTKLQKYMDYLNQGKTGDDKINFAAQGYNENYFANLYAEEGVRTKADITPAIYAKAEAELAKAKTVGTVKAEKATAEQKIDALPTKVTTADKAAVEDALKAVKDYNTSAGKNYANTDVVNINTLSLAVKAIAKEEKDALTETFAKLPTTAKVTVADKEAVKAAKEAAKKYNEDVDGIYSDVLTDADKFTDDVTDGLLAKIKEAEKKAVEDAINALPLNITPADKEAVEAARKLYDAYVNEYSDPAANTPVDARTDFSESKKNELFKAEAALAAAEKDANAKEKLAVEGTHMKIYSSAKKGYIKISWKKSNSEVALDGVEVYRSTKKTSGFKKISTFKKQTAKKYTKNMKKGTKYYFYVKGYKMVGDEKVYTHNSIKVARTFRK